MNRRHFLVAAAGTGVALGSAIKANPQAPRATFKLKYAPHFGMFRHSAGEDPIDQLKFIAEQGFLALEDNGMKSRPLALQEKIAAEMSRLGLEMGVFVATADFENVTFASPDPAAREKILKDIRESVEVAQRVNARWVTVVPGRYDLGKEWDYQTAQVIDNLKRCAEILEPHNLVMVLEPLNPWTNHPGLFLTKIPQAYMICRSVNSPACKILFDIYHQQITEGNLIPNMEMAWDEIGYFQTGDNPGRNEPTTGEINYLNIFKYIHSRGYNGILGMEHGNSRPGVEGEKAVIEAYRQMDTFEA
ncbi:MAG TPA: TIM barrel protein [Acidobacteriota bacterium]|nr:TIM barrel protein [Acidobacteriota bacterium]